jgi:hypothetical protein
MWHGPQTGWRSLWYATRELSRDPKTTGVPSRMWPRPCLRGWALAQLNVALQYNFYFGTLSCVDATPTGDKLVCAIHLSDSSSSLLSIVIPFDRRSFPWSSIRSHAPPGHLSPHRASTAAHCGL